VLPQYMETFKWNIKILFDCQGYLFNRCSMEKAKKWTA